MDPKEVGSFVHICNGTFRHWFSLKILICFFVFFWYFLLLCTQLDWVKMSEWTVKQQLSLKVQQPQGKLSNQIIQFLSKFHRKTPNIDKKCIWKTHFVTLHCLLSQLCWTKYDSNSTIYNFLYMIFVWNFPKYLTILVILFVSLKKNLSNFQIGFSLIVSYSEICIFDWSSIMSCLSCLVYKNSKTNSAIEPVE